MNATTKLPTAHQLIEMQLARREAEGFGDGSVGHADIYNALNALQSSRYRRQMIAEWQEKHGGSEAAAVDTQEEVDSTCT